MSWWHSWFDQNNWSNVCWWWRCRWVAVLLNNLCWPNLKCERQRLTRERWTPHFGFTCALQLQGIHWCALFVVHCVWTSCTVSVHTTSGTVSFGILLKPWKCHSIMKSSLKFRIYPCYHCNGTIVKILAIGYSIKAKLTVNAVLWDATFGQRFCTEFN